MDLPMILRNLVFRSKINPAVVIIIMFRSNIYV